VEKNLLRQRVEPVGLHSELYIDLLDPLVKPFPLHQGHSHALEVSPCEREERRVVVNALLFQNRYEDFQAHRG